MSIPTKASLDGGSGNGRAGASLESTLQERASKIPAYMFQFIRWFSDQGTPVSARSSEHALQELTREGPWQPYGKTQVDMILARTLVSKGFARSVGGGGGYLPTDDLRTAVAAGYFRFRPITSDPLHLSELQPPKARAT